MSSIHHELLVCIESLKDNRLSVYSYYYYDYYLQLSMNYLGEIPAM